MKTTMKRLMIMTLVLLGVALFMSTSASAIIVGTAPVGGTIFGPVMPGLITAPAIGLSPGLVRPPLGIPPGLVRPSLFNPFLIRPVFNPFLIRPVFNPFLDVDIDGIGLGLGLNPGLVD